jgi:hypothetical protein
MNNNNSHINNVLENLHCICILDFNRYISHSSQQKILICDTYMYMYIKYIDMYTFMRICI